VKYSFVIWLFLTYLSDIAWVGGFFQWVAYGVGGFIALYVATKIRLKAHKWFILIISLFIVIVGASNAVHAGVGGLGSILIQPFTFILIVSLLVSKTYVNFYIPSAKSIIVFFIIEVFIILLLGLLGISFFDINKGESTTEYRNVVVMTGLHSGSMHLYILYNVSSLILYEKYQNIFFRLLFLIFIGYLMYSLGSRAAILGFVVLIILLPFLHRRVFEKTIIITLLASPLIINALLHVFSDLSASYTVLESDSRLLAWSFALSALFQKWQYIIFGSGELNIVYYYGDKLIGLHNEYIAILSRFGVFLYIVICSFIYRVFSGAGAAVTRLSVIALMIMALLNGGVYGLDSFYLASFLMLIRADSCRKWLAGYLKAK